MLPIHRMLAMRVDNSGIRVMRYLGMDLKIRRALENICNVCTLTCVYYHLYDIFPTHSACHTLTLTTWSVFMYPVHLIARWHALALFSHLSLSLPVSLSLPPSLPPLSSRDSCRSERGTTACHARFRPWRAAWRGRRSRPRRAGRGAGSSGGVHMSVCFFFFLNIIFVHVIHKPFIRRTIHIQNDFYLKRWRRRRAVGECEIWPTECLRNLCLGTS